MKIAKREVQVRRGGIFNLDGPCQAGTSGALRKAKHEKEERRRNHETTKPRARVPARRGRSSGFVATKRFESFVNAAQFSDSFRRHRTSPAVARSGPSPLGPRGLFFPGGPGPGRTARSLDPAARKGGFLSLWPADRGVKFEINYLGSVGGFGIEIKDPQDPYGAAKVPTDPQKPRIGT